jgi:hypothetical protein
VTTPDFPHSAVLQVQAYEDGPTIERAYRWRVEEYGNGLRAVGQYKRGDGRWTDLRNPDRLAALLGLSPQTGTHILEAEAVS